MSEATAVATTSGQARNGQGDRVRQKDVRTTNIQAAKGVADAVRTSLGPRGMDKMVQHYFYYDYIIYIDDFVHPWHLDSKLRQWSRYQQWRRHYLKQDGGHSPCRQDGMIYDY